MYFFQSNAAEVDQKPTLKIGNYLSLNAAMMMPGKRNHDGGRSRNGGISYILRVII